MKTFFAHFCTEISCSFVGWDGGEGGGGEGLSHTCPSNQALCRLAKMCIQVFIQHMTGGTWQVARGRWHVTRDTWQVTRDTRQVAHGRWHVAGGTCYVSGACVADQYKSLIDIAKIIFIYKKKITCCFFEHNNFP